ncbi:SulP family inorganic anion transporter [Trinickia sp. EG282A]|uniref:SulP family inorganic anion transporter n=1 Tax=Trinickia sp. EG282A TaxID=3237013 RepID=UPI0034D16696
MTNAKFMATLPRDCCAGVAVFLVALPLCLGIAQASGVNAIAGLLAGVIGGLVVALLSGSRLSVSGPAAGLIAIVVEGLANVGGFSAFLSAVFVAGVAQFCFGALGLGRFASCIPSTVIKGMLAAIGLLLIVKQFPVAFGWFDADANPMGGGTDARLDTPFGSVSLVACALALLSFAVLWAWDTKWVRRSALLRSVPAPLVVVVLGIFATVAIDAWLPQLALPADQRVNLAPIDSLAALAQWVTLPDFSALTSVEVWRLAGTLAIVASVETLLSLQAIEQMDPMRRSASQDRELRAQGVGNMLAGMLGALPITAVIVRSTANLHAGAQTRASAFVHGVLILASLFALTSVLNLIPLACLAAILIATGAKLAKPSVWVETAKSGVDRFVPFIATIAGVMATDLLIGVAIGVACSAFLAFRSTLKQAFLIDTRAGEFVLQFRKDPSCFIKAGLKDRLGALPDGSTLVVDASRADTLDADIREYIGEFARRSAERGIKVQWRDAAARAPAELARNEHGEWGRPSPRGNRAFDRRALE